MGCLQLAARGSAVAYGEERNPYGYDLSPSLLILSDKEVPCKALVMNLTVHIIGNYP